MWLLSLVFYYSNRRVSIDFISEHREIQVSFLVPAQVRMGRLCLKDIFRAGGDTHIQPNNSDGPFSTVPDPALAFVVVIGHIDFYWEYSPVSIFRSSGDVIS